MAKKKPSQKKIQRRKTPLLKKAADPTAGRRPGASSPAHSAVLPSALIPPSGESKIFPVVGVGASAGGLEAFRSLLGALPESSPLSFVIIQHLSPNHASMLPEILGKSTSLPVLEIKDGMEPRQGTIHVMPPNTTVTLEEGKLRLKTRQGAARNMPIDVFFRSLAQDQPHRAIGVILSGAGTDGSLGLQEVKAAGGVTFVQDEKSAKFDGMPRSALSTGDVDFILPPEQISAELARICEQMRYTASSGEDANAMIQEQEHINKIFGLLRRTSGVDFSMYKQTTIRRRITRRMLLLKQDSLLDYLELLRKKPEEVQALYQDILIKVTSFFRDPEAFEAVKRMIIPDLMAKRNPDSALRIWVPGCSTGEEAYSLAIIILESLGDMSANTPVQIFATDISEESLAKARSGVYLENIALDVSPERLRRYFVRMDSHYQISKHIRDMCIFARQDVTQDHPFSRIDLISCRNLLIYLDVYLQRKVFPIFHYALKPTGHLMLGTSETVGAFTELFMLSDKKNKIYSKKQVSSRFNLPMQSHAHFLSEKVEPKRAPGQGWSGVDVQKEADRVVLGNYAPAGVVINGDMEIMQFRGHTGAYLEPAPGQASLNVLKMVRPALLMELRKTIDAAKKAQIATGSEWVRMDRGNKPRLISMEVAPLSANSGGQETYYLVLFKELPMNQPAEQKAGKAAKPAERRPGQEGQEGRLRKELEAAKDYLQSIIEEQEATNEELKSANEEILSSNEELQSINEELETAKEELQSTNEELTTLNEELQNRNQELNVVSNDLSNLLASVNVPIVMLGDDLRIRRFTPMAEKILKLIPSDVGRPLSDIKTSISLADLDQKILEVIDTITVTELEVQDHTGRWYSLRIRPYRTSENKIDGAVLVFIDIDVLKTTMAQFQGARKYSENIVETVRSPLLVLDSEWKIRSANRAYLDTFPSPPGEVVGRSILDLGYGGHAVVDLPALLGETWSQGRVLRDVEASLAGPGNGRTLIINAGRLPSLDKGERSLILLALEDITDRKRAETEVHRLNSELGARIGELTTANLRLQNEVSEREKAEETLQNTISELESFSYSVSHDLRAPLRAMQGVAEALQEDYKDKLDATGLDYTRRIVSASHRLDGLIQDLLNYSRFGRFDSEIQPCNLDQAVDEALSQLEKEVKDSGAEVDIRKPLGQAMGNQVLLETVILNLVSNALKFVPQGVHPRMRIYAEHENGSARLWVEDNGIGIDPDHHNRIFRVFERLHGIEKYPGTGIGLAIVRKGVESCGGKVGVESAPGRGSRFWVELPTPGRNPAETEGGGP